MLPSRKKFQFAVAPTDRQLWAIGMVAVQWSLLEQYVKVYMHALATDDARKQFDQTLSTKARLRQLRDVVTERVMQPFQNDILTIVDQIGGMQQERDRIIHGAWTTEGPFDYGKPRKPFEWNLTYGQILDVALKIEGLTSRAIEYAFTLKTKEDNFTLGDALRRTLCKPNPDQ